MQIEARSHGDVTVVSLSGEFDAADEPRVRRRLEQAIGADARKLVLNVRGVRFINLSNLGAVVGIARGLRERNGDLVLSEPSGLLRSTIRTLGLEGTLRLFDRDLDAVRHFRQADEDRLALADGNVPPPREGPSSCSPAEPPGSRRSRPAACGRPA
jgi:anti-anti-sigma factor